MLHLHNSDVLSHYSFNEGQNLTYFPASVCILKLDKYLQQILFTETYDFHVITLPQLLILVSPINACKATLLHMGYNKCSSYFEGKKSTPGNFSSWHSVNSSKLLLPLLTVFVSWFLLHSQSVPFEQCYFELQSKNQYVSIKNRNIILFPDFTDSFKNSKLNLFKASFEQFIFKEIKNSYKNFT